jgi:hypothetical protein
MLSYYLLDIPAEDSGQDFPLDPRHAGVGIIEIAHSVAIDDERKLIFVADEARIKSYAWGTSTGEVFKSPRPAHILHSQNPKAHWPFSLPDAFFVLGKASPICGRSINSRRMALTERLALAKVFALKMR